MKVRLADGSECDDRRINNASNGTLKVWHFIASQIVLFIAVVSFSGMFINNLKAEIKDYAYPKLAGEFLQKAITDLTSTVKESNELLTQLRIDIAGGKSKSEIKKGG